MEKPEEEEVGARMMEDEEIRLKKKSHFQNRPANAEDVSSKIAALSPKSQRKIHLIIENVSRNKAWIGEDKQGNPTIMYDDSKKVPELCHVDKSESNMIQQPRTEEDMRKRIGSLLELIKYEKENRTPGGVVIDKTRITTKQKQYREGEEFVKTGEILGSGNVAGEIIVVKDIGSGADHALKTVMMSEFREDEVRVWVDLEGSGICPSLYLIRKKDNKICLHMEILESAVTLNDVLEDHLQAIPKDYVRPFSLYVFKGLLSVVKTMHDKNWSHRDLHAGNVMIQKNSQSLDIKVIDFGKANEIYGPESIDFAGRDDDILQTIRQFSALYTGQMFDSANDLKKNYKETLCEMSNLHEFSFADRVELFQLVDIALNVTNRPHMDGNNSHVGNIDDVISEIDKQLKPVDVDEMCKKVAAILFSESEYLDLHTDDDLGSKGSEEDCVDSPETLERRAASIPDEFIRSLRAGLTIRPQ